MSPTEKQPINRPGERSGSGEERRARRLWPGYSAAAVAFAFPAVSIAWGLGSTAGLSSLGGRIEALARAGDPLIVTLAWGSAAAKAAGGILALALAQRWGLRLPQRWLLLAAWSGVAVRSRLLLWEPWFLVWGLLLALAAWSARTHRD